MAKKEKKDDSLRNNDDSLKELYERQKNEIIRRKLDTKEIERYSVVKVVNNGRKNNYGNLKEKENSDSVVKVKVEVKDKTCNSFKEEIDERLKTKDEIGKINKGRKNNYGNLKEKEKNSDSVVKVKVEVKDKKCNSLRGKIDERVELIERSIIDTQNDSLEKVVNKEDSSKKSNNSKEEIDERLKSIERTIDYTRDNSLVELAKKIEILNSSIVIKEIKKRT